MKNKLEKYLQQQKQRKTLLYEGKAFFKNMRKLGIRKEEAQVYKQEVNLAIRTRRAEEALPNLKTRAWDTAYGKFGQKFGKELLVRSSPEVVRYMDVNSGDFGYMTPTVRRQLKQIMNATVPKRRIVKELKRELKSKEFSDEWKAQEQVLLEDIQQSKKAGMDAITWKPTTDWYEENKKDLRNLSDFKEKIESGKGSLTAEEIEEAKASKERTNVNWMSGLEGAKTPAPGETVSVSSFASEISEHSDISLDVNEIIRRLQNS